jgi:hypothetical protein
MMIVLTLLRFFSPDEDAAPTISAHQCVFVIQMFHLIHLCAVALEVISRVNDVHTLGAQYALLVISAQLH